MKTYKNIIYCLLSFAVVNLFSSCKKFLTVTPSSQSVNPTTMRDFQEILNNDSLSRGNFFLLDLMSDDATISDANYEQGNTFYRRVATWAPEIWNPAQIDFMYNYTYGRILQMNVILSRVDNAIIDEINTPRNRNLVISQALINRASYYLQLVNTYGPAYDPATSASDPGVPLVLSPDANTLPSRASVEAVYTSVIADLRRAIANTSLPAKGIDIVHPGKAAGFGLLARAYLYRGDYVSANAYADSALRQENRLLNLTTQNYFPQQLQDIAFNPEILLGRASIDDGFFSNYRTTFTIGQSLLDSLGGTFSADRRFNTRFSFGRFSNRTYNGNTTNQFQMVFDASIGVPEMMLIRAECLARRGNFQEAGSLIDRLRSNRIPANALGTRNYTSANILNYVLGERRRELCFKGGLRLFDLKRLNREPALRVNLIKRNLFGTTEWATLSAGSPRYLLPFSSGVLAANPNITQNPR